MLWKRYGLWYSPDGEGGSSGGTGDKKDADDAQNQSQSDSNEKKFTQADIDRIVQDRLARASVKAEEERKKAEDKAKADVLAEQGEFKTLAERLQADLEATEPVKKRVEVLEGLIKASVDKVLAEMPEAVRTLLNKLPVEEQFDWISKNSDTITKGIIPGVPPTPNGSGDKKTKTLADIVKEKSGLDYSSI